MQLFIRKTVKRGIVLMVLLCTAGHTTSDMLDLYMMGVLPAIVANQNKVVDKEKPVLTLVGAERMNLQLDDTYNEEGATCEDNSDKTCSVVIGGDTVDTSTVGTYIVTYNATDSSGNEADELTRTVTVEDPALVVDDFAFVDEIGVEYNVWVSASMVVSGLGAEVNVSISSSGYEGQASHSYFTVNDETDVTEVKNGDVVEVRHLSSNEDNTTLNTLITIGTKSDTFSSKTKQNDSVKLPLIVGAPNFNANVHEVYSYLPQLSTDADNFAPATKPFTIENRPQWATFDTSTGELSGTPTQTAVHHNIKISAYGDNGMDSIVYDLRVESNPPYINPTDLSLENPDLVLTFNENADWRSKVTAVALRSCYSQTKGVILDPADYTFTEGTLTLHASTSVNVALHIPTMGGGGIEVVATDYENNATGLIDYIVDGQYGIKATVSASESLTELNIDNQTLVMNLSNYLEFNDSSLVASNFNIWDPDIEVSSVVYVSPTEANITLAFNGNDFDTNKTFTISISPEEMNVCEYVSTNDINVEAIVEVPTYIYPDDPTENAIFGFDIDTDNEKVATLARNGIYIHEKDSNGEYQQKQKIVPPTDYNISADSSSIAIDGEYLVYGDGMYYVNAERGFEGKVYIYKKDLNGFYTLDQNFTGTGVTSFAHFGASVDISDDLLIVGAYNDDDHKGAAYLYQLNTTSGDFEQKERLTRQDGKEMDWFGYDVTIDGNYFVVGSMSTPIVKDDKDELGSGFAYYYNYLSDTLEVMAELKASDSTDLSDHFGISVDISSDHIIVGTYDKGAYLFKREFDTASENGKLTPEEGEKFGSQVAMLYSSLTKYIVLGEQGSWNYFSTKGFAFIQSSSTNPKNSIETNAEDKLSNSVSVDENFAYFSMPYNEDKKVYHHGAVMVVEHGQSYNLDVEDTVAYISGTRDLLDVELDITIVFDAEIIQINSEVNITISGGEYSIDDGLNWIDYSTPITATQSIKIRHTSSGEYNRSTSTTLSVGTQSATFTSITMIEADENEDTNGTVTVGELMWEDTPETTSSSSTHTWSDANSYCQDLDLAGYTDWRLSHIDEDWVAEISSIRVASDGENDDDIVIIDSFNPVRQGDGIASWTDKLNEDSEESSHIAMIFRDNIENGDSFFDTEELNVRCVRDIAK